MSEWYRREDDRLIGSMMEQIKTLQATVERLEIKVDEMMALKNRGIGAVLILGAMIGSVSGWILDQIKSHMGVQ